MAKKNRRKYFYGDIVKVNGELYKVQSYHYPSMTYWLEKDGYITSAKLEDIEKGGVK